MAKKTTTSKTNAPPRHLPEEKIINTLTSLKHCVFPRPFERLALAGRRKLVGVEIGVLRGLHAESLLRHCHIKCLYLVDPYQDYAEYEEGRKHYGKDQAPLDVNLKECSRRLKRYEKRIVRVFKMSADALKDIPNNLDFVYIDGNHQLEFVREDIRNYYPKVRKGGILGGHDFYNGFQREHDGVVTAVAEFAVKNKLPLQVELPDWWIEKP